MVFGIITKSDVPLPDSLRGKRWPQKDDALIDLHNALIATGLLPDQSRWLIKNAYEIIEV